MQVICVCVVFYGFYTCLNLSFCGQDSLGIENDKEQRDRMTLNFFLAL